MTLASNFLELCAFQLVQHEGCRVVKTPPDAHDGLAWTPGWDDWEEVLAAEGPGVQPAIYVIRNGTGLTPSDVSQMLGNVTTRVMTNLGAAPSGLHVKVVAILYFDMADPAQARALSKVVPQQYVRGISPQTWVADLSTGKLWAPKTLGVMSSRNVSAIEKALDGARQGQAVAGFDIARAETDARNQRMEFASTVQRNVPYVTYALLAACVLVFLMELSAAHGFQDSIGNGVLIRFGAIVPRRIEHGQVWRLFTAMFVHVSFAHILFNGIALFSVGGLVERVYGHARFAIIYFASGLFASLVSFSSMALRGENIPAAGASGAIFGIAGVVIVLGVIKTSIVPRAIARQMSIYMGGLIGINLLFDYFTPEIDISAHLGGLVAGIILGYLLAPTSRVPANRWVAADSQA